METAAALLVISSLLVTVITAFIARPSTTPTQKRVIVIVASIVIGAITAIVNGQIEGVPPEAVAWIIKVLVTVAIVATGSQGAYLLFKDPVKALEAKSSGEPVPVA